jgi:Gpi18-like mannosyltransferase
MKTSKPVWIWFLISVFFILAVGFRLAAVLHRNVDTNGYLRWYALLSEQGFRGLSQGFAVYTPPYLYLLWLGTLLRGTLPPLLVIKLIPTLFDVVSAIAVYKLVRLRFPQGPLPWLACASFLVLPTVILNSAYWGQIDSLYASFLLWCLYFVLTNRPFRGMLAFGASFAFKAQAVFLLPFLLVMALKRRVPWTYFVFPPLIYLLSILPAVYAGRPLADALTIYLGQVQAFPQLAMHAPNLYSVIPFRFAPVAYPAGLVLSVILLGVWIVFYGVRTPLPMNARAILLTALLSLVLVPFLLPRMHDRYFYPADLLSFVMIFFAPSYAIVAAGYQLISGLVYYIFLHSVTPEQNLLMLRSAVLLNTIMVTGLVIHQYLVPRASVGGSQPLEASGEGA